MSLLNTLRHRAACHSFSAPLRRGTLLTSSHVGSQLRARWPALTRAPLLRCESTAASQARKAAVIYPEMLNVYRSGTARVLFVGLFRITSLVAFFLGAVVYSPSFFFSPDHSSLLVPVCIVVSAAPVVVMTLTTGPVVHALRIRLPSHVRRSRAELQRFATNVPLDTVVEVHCIRFWPIPRAKEVLFKDLRRTRPSFKIGLSNLENVPAVAKAKERTFWGWWVHRWLGRFYVEMNQKKDKSGSPGTWNTMWEQIPESGHEREPSAMNKERKPVLMVGRSAKVTERPRVKPPRIVEKKTKSP